jgi:Asp-tRNA(Asn)/Glu-tRNA(Gln) amidotransferase C subunit
MSAPVRVTEAEVERLAALVDLPIDPADRAAVAQQLSGLLNVARLVTEFPLPDDVEPAPVFRP